MLSHAQSSPVRPAEKSKAAIPLPFYTINGLWRGISGKSPFTLSFVVLFALVLLYPFSRIWNDCFAAFFSIDDAVGALKTEGTP
jgi:hypothetical protein